MTQENMEEAQYELDLRGVICPYNFVKTKLKLDSMACGEMLAIIVDDGEPIQNVPRSVENEGHVILGREKCGQAYRVLIQKGHSDPS